tara:strand:- start:1783 stop:2487 length:705 start_codon:yes stop_codon:yes gene_type:complete
MKDLLDNWNNYLLLECGPQTTAPLDEGSKKSHYDNSPIEPDGKTTKRKKRERFNKRKSKTTFGMTEPFSRGELDLLRSTSIHNLTEEDDETDCVRGNPIHKKDDGKFGTDKDIGSWSKGYHSKKTGCEKGKLRKPSSGKATTWTKADKCGRDGEYLCGTKDTKKWNSPNLKSEVYSVLQEIFSEFQDFDAVLEGQQGNITAETCKRMGFRTFNEFLRSIDSIKRAEQGKLFDKE